MLYALIKGFDKSLNNLHVYCIPQRCVEEGDVLAIRVDTPEQVEIKSGLEGGLVKTWERLAGVRSLHLSRGQVPEEDGEGKGGM